MANLTNYHHTSTTTATIDSSCWHKVLFKRLNFQGWLNKNEGGLVGGFQVDYSSNSVRFQREEDLMFFKLSTSL